MKVTKIQPGDTFRFGNKYLLVCNRVDILNQIGYFDKYTKMLSRIILIKADAMYSSDKLSKELYQWNNTRHKILFVED